MQPREVLPLDRRPGDRWLVVAFIVFAATSVFVDRLAALDVDVCEQQRMWGALCWYGRNLDPLYLANPQWLRVMSGISAYVFGPLYLLFAWAFWRGHESVRGPALAWAVAILYSMAVHMWMELFGELPPPRPLMLIGVYLPYALVPVLVLTRLRSPHPFTRAPEPT